MRALNLSRRPFVNVRPVARTAVLLWVLGGLVFAANLALYWRYLAGSGDKQAKLRSVERAIADESARSAELERDLRRLDLQAQNDQVDFLNRRIAERTFAWSRLFDHLGEVLPEKVRIYSLSPLNIVPERERRGARAPIQPLGDRVGLRIDGAAEGTEPLLAFIDALFAHPAFDQPKLDREARENQFLRFDLGVVYLPEAGEASGPAPVIVEEGPPPAAPAPTSEPPSAAAEDGP
jgi:Tfp pilus assembly protein PilN